LDAGRNNFLCAVARVKGEGEELGLAWADMSTGEFRVSLVSQLGLAAELSRLDPREVLVPEPLFDDGAFFDLWSDYGAKVTTLPPVRFDSSAGEGRLKALYGVQTLDGLGTFARAEVAAAGALADYLELTQVGKMPALSRLIHVGIDEVMAIDAATRANLELTRTLAGSREGSLLSVIDRTVTAAGARELGARLAAPLTDPARISARQDGVAFYLENNHLREDARSALKQAPDLLRALTRISLARGGPRDLAAIKDGLLAAKALGELHRLDETFDAPPAEVSHALDAVGPWTEDLVQSLSHYLADELPLMTRDGGFIRKEAVQDLDELRGLRDDARKVIAGLQQNYAELAGVKNLKIRHNNMLGYYIEVPASHGERLRTEHIDLFIHRQSMANAMRFTTELESKIAQAAGKAVALELEIFDDLCAEVLKKAEEVARLAGALAGLDVASSLAELADRENFCRPVVDDAFDFAIKGGRHPVVEAALRRAGGEPFVANDCDLSAIGAQRLWLVTGPNMAGKSTYLRQNALIAILAQMGAYIPADEARLGVVDRLFSRVGAADDLARGRSTFMVEMVETAAILNQATKRSLVILDEIGRGTATFDGLSIAWATLEHLHEANKCRGLFATHYHELTALTETLPSLATATMKVREWKGDVVFLHEVVPGTADRSYGIQVAKLAGLPDAVTARAHEVLQQLEASQTGGAPRALVDDLPLFSAKPAVAPKQKGPSELEKRLEAINPDELTPKEALELLYELKSAPHH
jgi:DNA mismatch repair protein MutS